MKTSSEILKILDKKIQTNLNQSKEKSYVAKMNSLGIDEMLKKITEEATELVLASKNKDRANLTHEVADLWFHCLLVLHQHNLSSSDVLNELINRLGVSGIDEKKSRTEE